MNRVFAGSQPRQVWLFRVHQGYGLSLSKPLAILNMADSIPGVRASYIERGRANMMFGAL